ncbi:phosphopyruvate hydratase [Candidatus Woesearchaeota archaeon]|nr:phosphopyruvate hydratase [Candidatus Woesearchaeota archaeon]
MKINEMIARMVLDSRGNPTVECEMHNSYTGVRAIVPSGKSTGKHEAVELRDKKSSFNGMGVEKAVKNINKIIKKNIINKDWEQETLDNFLIKLDNTENKSRLGANAILAVSMAFARLNAMSKNDELFFYLQKITGNKKISLPIPFCNVINGGVHAGNDLMMQEFMIVPKAGSFKENTRIISETYHELKRIIRKKYGKNAVNVGDEGGFAPPIETAEEALDLLMKAIINSKHKSQLRIAMDCAASDFYKKGKYEIEKNSYVSAEELGNYYIKLIKKYPIVSIEDPFAEDDFEAWNKFMEKINKRNIQVVGDDLLVSNKKRIEEAAEKKLCNGLLLKPNQIGTVTEAIEAAKSAMKNNWNVMVSHRSGETEDTFICDLAVALNCKQIKIGAPCRGERTCKFNRLLRIEELI